MKEIVGIWQYEEGMVCLAHVQRVTYWKPRQQKKGKRIVQEDDDDDEDDFEKPIASALNDATSARVYVEDGDSFWLKSKETVRSFVLALNTYWETRS